MPKPAKKRNAAKSAASSKEQSRKTRETHHRVAARSGTKQSAAIAMLRSSGGATITALTKTTGWQPHSVRGFLAGVVRKRLKLDLQSVVVNGVRVYRVAGGLGPAETKAGRKP